MRRTNSVAFRFIAANDHPDHDTIAAFRRRFLAEIEALFVQVLLLAREMGVLKMGTVALDGTKISANASRHSALSYEHAGKTEAQLKAEVADLMAKAEAADAADLPDGMSIPDELARREERLRKLAEARAKIEARAKERHAREQAEHEARLAARQAKAEASGKKPRGKPPEPPVEGPRPNDQINLTDEESRIMPVAGGGFDQCYNAQAAVAAGSLLVVASAVSQAPNDKQQLEPMLDKIEALADELGKPECLLADTGYFSAANVAACDMVGIEPLIAIAGARALPAVQQKTQLLFAANERRHGPRAAATAAAARAHDAIERHWRRSALEFARRLVLGDKQPGGLPLDGGSNEDGTRLRKGLYARGDIGRVAEHFAGRVHHHLPGLEANARGELRRVSAGVPGVEFAERLLDGERGAHRAFGVVLLRLRIAEQGHQPVAEFLQHMAAEAGHRRRGLVEIGVDEVAPVLRVEFRGEARRADEIAEHHGDRPALGKFLPRFAGEDGRGKRRHLRRGACLAQRGDRAHEPLAMPERHADLLEVGLGQVRQDLRVDLMLPEQRFVLSEADRVQPLGDVHRTASAETAISSPRWGMEFEDLDDAFGAPAYIIDGARAGSNGGASALPL